MGKLLKILGGLVVMAALAGGGYSWLQSRETSDHGFEFIPIERGSITEKALAVGQIEPRVKFHVKSKISGIVKRCAVEVGDYVEAGDPLFEIVPDPTPTRAGRGGATGRGGAVGVHRRAQADWNRVAASWSTRASSRPRSSTPTASRSSSTRIELSKRKGQPRADRVRVGSTAAAASDGVGDPRDRPAASCSSGWSIPAIRSSR